MPIRITGMNSGLDTESIISELVKAQKSKVEKVKKKQTTLEWKQEAWKDLNVKIGKLFSSLNNIRFSADWSKKTTDLSDSSVASVLTSDTAMNAAQDLTVQNLASSAYITGNKVSKTGATNATKMSELGYTDNSSISVEIGGKTTNIAIDGDTAIGDVVDKLRAAGVEASFDADNGRLHVAAKSNGVSIKFSATNNDADGENALKTLGLWDDTKGAAKSAEGKKAKIILNGQEYESDSNTFSINGLTITAKAAGTTTLTTKRDTEGIYDMAKNFLKEYNTLIGEMDKLYNAESSKGYDPLTDEEKESMTESEIEKWEAKIKDSVLRRDSNLNTLASAMKNVMLKGATVNGKQMYLSNFGIETLGYWEAEDNEKSIYHIQGDADFTAVSSQTNKLKEMVEKDPDTVIEFFSQLSMNMYKELNQQSSPIKDVRSFGKFYDDKLMESDYKEYTTKIKEQEAKLTAMEDKWYKKFAAMETAMAKMQSNQNALSSLLGG